MQRPDLEDFISILFCPLQTGDAQGMVTVLPLSSVSPLALRVGSGSHFRKALTGNSAYLGPFSPPPPPPPSALDAWKPKDRLPPLPWALLVLTLPALGLALCASLPQVSHLLQ